VDVPHYGLQTDDIYNHTVGALCTIDRPYPWLIDELHHHIGTTHVAHHLNVSVPHYRAVACTKELKELLGDRYLFDNTPIVIAVFKTARDCMYVDRVDGVQNYKTK